MVGWGRDSKYLEGRGRGLIGMLSRHLSHGGSGGEALGNYDIICAVRTTGKKCESSHAFPPPWYHQSSSSEESSKKLASGSKFEPGSSSVQVTHPWSWALFEKPLIVQLLKNFTAFYRTRRFIIVFTRALHLSLPEPDRSSPHHPILSL
jgi:hypothetical protein